MKRGRERVERGRDRCYKKEGGAALQNTHSAAIDNRAISMPIIYSAAR